MTPRRWLFFKEAFAWPRASGHDVHTYYLMRALAEQGHAVSLATLDVPPEAAVEGVAYARRFALKQMPPAADSLPLTYSKSQAKFQNYWGTDTQLVRRLAVAAQECNADVVVVSGLNVLPYLGGIAGRQRVWYAADEWVWHHWSQVKLLSPGTWGELKQGVVKGLYERAYRGMVDRVWVVSDADAKAFKWLAGTPHTAIVPNGVDAKHYRPLGVEAEPNTCVFWGRLDFGPNIQAVEHFVRRVWPAVRRFVPAARFKVYGFQPGDAVRRLAGRDGIELVADVPDIRPAVQSAQVVVLPFVSGGGIKNKLLEAAAMGMPIVATRRAAHGLVGEPPLTFARGPAAWPSPLVALWGDAGARQKAGAANRAWVLEHHTWAAAAKRAAESVAGGGA